MALHQHTPQVKNISASGQISLGKEFAGQAVSVEEPEPGVWLIKLGQFVPNNERWLFEQDVQEELVRAEAYAANNAPVACDLGELEARATRA
jgi:hypothetical protein